MTAKEGRGDAPGGRPVSRSVSSLNALIQLIIPALAGPWHLRFPSYGFSRARRGPSPCLAGSRHG